MNDRLLRLIQEFKKNRSLLSFDEAATKQVVVLRILRYLGWDQYNRDEVYPEYSVAKKSVDYALRYNGSNKVFIEVKKINEDLEKHQKQLLDYSFEEGIRLSILTNGISWWFYLPLHEGSWEQRKFYTIEIIDQESEDVVKKFEELLSKENVISGKAVENAENLYENRQKQYIIKETLPKAWNKIRIEPDEALVELLADTTEKLCGYRPGNEMVEQFLMRVSKEIVVRPKKEIPHSVSSFPHSEVYTGKSIAAFTFKGIRYPAHSWRDMLLKITNLMISAHREQLDKILNLRGRKRPYFTRNPDELRSPQKINGADVFVETNLSANNVVKLSKDVISLFGYKEDDLSIEAR